MVAGDRLVLVLTVVETVVWTAVVVEVVPAETGPATLDEDVTEASPVL